MQPGSGGSGYSCPGFSLRKEETAAQDLEKIHGEEKEAEKRIQKAEAYHEVLSRQYLGSSVRRKILRGNYLITAICADGQWNGAILILTGI